MTDGYIRSLTGSAPIRLSVPLPEPNRGRGAHGPEVIQQLRTLFTTTILPYREMARRTGTSPSTIARLSRWNGWVRRQAPLADECVTAKGRRAARRAAIAEACLAHAEHLAFQREMDPASTERRLFRAARLVRLARALDEEERTATSRKVGRRKPEKPIFETPLAAYGGPPLPSVHKAPASPLAF